MSVSSFSQSTLNHVPLVTEDSTGVTLLAFDSLQLNHIITDLKNTGWNKKQITSLEKQVKNLKWKSYKQGVLIDTLENQVETYISISFNLKKQVEIKQEKIDELEGIKEKYKKLDDNMIDIKNAHEAKIKKKNGKIAILIGTNTLTIILLILSVMSN